MFPGNTRVLAVVYGPHEPTMRSRAQNEDAIVNCEYSVATFSTNERRKRAKGDRRATDTELLISQTFEAAIMTHLYPRAQIDIYIQILQSDGGSVLCLQKFSLSFTCKNLMSFCVRVFYAKS